MAEQHTGTQVPGTVSVLHLPLKGCYFDAIKAGAKPEEYRLTTPYWRRRLEGRTYAGILLTKGYPARDDQERRLSLPWRGCTVKTIQNEFFGPAPVEVFAIDVDITHASGKITVTRETEFNRERLQASP